MRDAAHHKLVHPGVLPSWPEVRAASMTFAPTPLTWTLADTLHTEHTHRSTPAGHAASVGSLVRLNSVQRMPTQSQRRLQMRIAREIEVGRREHQSSLCKSEVEPVWIEHNPHRIVAFFLQSVAANRLDRTRCRRLKHQVLITVPDRFGCVIGIERIPKRPRWIVENAIDGWQPGRQQRAGASQIANHEDWAALLRDSLQQGRRPPARTSAPRTTGLNPNVVNNVDRNQSRQEMRSHDRRAASRTTRARQMAARSTTSSAADRPLLRANAWTTP